MKKIVFHPHALYKMKEREIDMNIVVATLKFPDITQEARRGRRVAQKVRGEYVLRVIYEEDIKHIVIITAYWTRKRRYVDG